MSVRRVSIRADRVVVDLVLPAGPAVCELMPAVVRMLDDGTTPVATGLRWRLDRPCGPRLDEGLSLNDNGVDDGELLVLVTEETPPFGPWGAEPFRAVIGAGATVSTVSRTIPDALCVTAVVVAALTLAWAGVRTTATPNLVVAAAGACVAAGTAISTRHAAANVGAVALAASTGLLAVPSGPGTPNVFLAAIAAFSSSVLMWRVSGRASPTMVATASFSVLLAVALLVGMTVPVGITGLLVASIGAVLSTCALAAMAVSPRVSMVAAGLGPDLDVGARGQRAHDVLTGLVVGCAAAAALGAIVVTVTGSASEGIASSAVVGLVLMLRVRTHVDPFRRIALLATGLGSGVAAIALTAATLPMDIGWLSAVLGALLVGAGLVAVRHRQLSAATHRTLGYLEYAALAAVFPVACWTAGAYAVISGTQSA